MTPPVTDLDQARAWLTGAAGHIGECAGIVERSPSGTLDVVTRDLLHIELEAGALKAQIAIGFGVLALRQAVASNSTGSFSGAYRDSRAPR